MIQKKTLPQKKTNLKDEITIVNTMRKSQLTASNEFKI